MAQTYDTNQTYQFNYDRGPSLDSSLGLSASHADSLSPGVKGDTSSETAPCSKTFLGLKVRSRLGIAAGILLNSKWVAPYAKLGFDILTYKTVRSSPRPCYPPPNWVFVEDRENADGPVFATAPDFSDREKITSAVCFGMPSMAPDVWRRDVGRARESLADGQLLMVSVVATPHDHASADEVADDFCRCAEWAVEAGADVIEANFSCPNVCSAEGTIYLDAELSRQIAQRIRSSIGKTPLLIKTGDFGRAGKLQDFLRSVGGAASGVTLVNCIVRPVLHPDGRPVFGEQFRSVGVAGRAIHKPSVEIVRSAVEMIERDELGLSIAAVGGVSRITDIEDFFLAGASAVLMGSAPMYLPHLAAEAKRLHPEW